MKVKLDQRLLDIFGLIEDDYHEIWDTCCDHGKLGLSLLEVDKASVVHFVDPVPSIMDKLETKLLELQRIDSLVSERYRLHTMKAQSISLSLKKSLICICGVGGDVAIEIIKGVLNGNNLAEHDILISAQYHLHDLRKFLIQEDFKVRKELLSFSGKWGYEVLLVSFKGDLLIDPIGRALFDPMDPRHQLYFKRIISHYKRKANNDPGAKTICESYEKLLND